MLTSLTEEICDSRYPAKAAKAEWMVVRRRSFLRPAHRSGHLYTYPLPSGFFFSFCCLSLEAELRKEAVVAASAVELAARRSKISKVSKIIIYIDTYLDIYVNTFYNTQIFLPYQTYSSYLFYDTTSVVLRKPRGSTRLFAFLRRVSPRFQIFLRGGQARRGKLDRAK